MLSQVSLSNHGAENATLFCQQNSFVSQTTNNQVPIQGSRLVQNGREFQVIPKSPAEVSGEYVLRPMIDRVSLIFKAVTGKILQIPSLMNLSLNKFANTISFPAAHAHEITPSEEQKDVLDECKPTIESSEFVPAKTKEALDDRRVCCAKGGVENKYDLRSIKAQLMNEGAAHIPSFLNQDEIDELRAGVDEVVGSSGLNSKSYKILNIIEKTKKLDHLFNHEKLMPILQMFLGDYFQVLSSEIFVRAFTNKTSVKFHTDGGPSLQKILPNRDNLLIQLKVQVFLTDMESEESGNFMYIPGSHLKFAQSSTEGCYLPELNDQLETGEYPKGTKQVLAKAGDILVFPWSLWHGVSKNTKDTRKSICIRYGQMWCKPLDYFSLKPETLSRLNDEQQRMFGRIHPEMDHPSYYYRPGEVEYRKKEVLVP